DRACGRADPRHWRGRRRLATPASSPTMANGRRSERQDAGAGPFVVPVVQAFTGRRRGVAVIAPPLVGWRWALGPWSRHPRVSGSMGGVIGALRNVLSLKRVVLELRDRPDARLAAREEDQHRHAVGPGEALPHLGPPAHRPPPVVAADARDAPVF